jgi:hypothetical protein
LQYNQPLAHPLGAAFTEFVFIAQAHVGDIWLDTKYITATFLGDQQGENFGQNIYLSQSTATTDTNLAPTNGTFTYLEINLAFMLNPRTNLQIFATLARREKNDGIILEKSDYFGFGLRSQIFNYYFDF